MTSRDSGSPRTSRALLDASAALRADATAFMKGVLGVRPWAAQRRILESVRRHRRTLVVSAHGVGKTNTGAAILCEHMATKPDAGAVVSSSVFDQARDILWAEVARLAARAEARGFPLGGRLLETSWDMPDGGQAVIQNPKNAVSAHGRHRSNMLILLDEAEAIPAEHLDAYDSLLSGGEGSMVAFLNPILSSGWCYEAARRPDVWNVIQISALDHPNVVSGREIIPRAVSRRWVEEKRIQWGEADPRFQSRVLGRFPESSTDQVVYLPILEKAAARSNAADVDVEPSMGLDVARSLGGDWTVALVMDRTQTVVAVERVRLDDLVRIAGWARAVADRHGVPAHRVGIDVCGGYGASVLDTLRAEGFRATGVDFGSAATGDWADLVGKDQRFKNRRAELHWAGRELLRRCLAGIPDRFPELWADLLVPIFWTDAAGKLCIESKDDIKSRLGRSPDQGDAFYLALGSRRRARDFKVRIL